MDVFVVAISNMKLAFIKSVIYSGGKHCLLIGCLIV